MTTNLNGQVRREHIQPPVQEYKRVFTEILATTYLVEGVARYCLGRVEQGIEKAYGERIFGSPWTPMSHELVLQGTTLVKDNLRLGLPGLVVSVGSIAALCFII